MTFNHQMTRKVSMKKLTSVCSSSTPNLLFKTQPLCPRHRLLPASHSFSYTAHPQPQDSMSWLRTHRPCFPCNSLSVNCALGSRLRPCLLNVIPHWISLRGCFSAAHPSYIVPSSYYYIILPWPSGDTAVLYCKQAASEDRVCIDKQDLKQNKNLIWTKLIL